MAYRYKLDLKLKFSKLGKSHIDNIFAKTMPWLIAFWSSKRKRNSCGKCLILKNFLIILNNHGLIVLTCSVVHQTNTYQSISTRSMMFNFVQQRPLFQRQTNLLPHLNYFFLTTNIYYLICITLKHE